MNNLGVLIVVNDFTTVYNFRLELVQYLLSNGFDVHLALPEDKRNQSLIALGCKIIPIHLSRFGTNPIADLRTMLEIKKIIKNVHPSIVLNYTAKPNIYGGIASRLTRTPYVCNVTGLGANFQTRNLIASIMLVLQKIAYEKALKIFFQNESNLDFFIKKGIVKDNYGLLPGSGVNVDTNCYEPQPFNNVTKFITIARIRQDKGYDELFSAIRKIKEAGIAAEFHIVGWYEEESYKRIVEEMLTLGNVKFYENVPHEEIHKLIAQCDCLIHPSHHEGMSNVILEAAACGRPCIVSNIHGCIESVDNNITGFHFEVKNDTSVFEQIVRFINLDAPQRQLMSKRAREKMVREFNRNIIIDEYMKLIKSLTNNSV